MEDKLFSSMWEHITEQYPEAKLLYYLRNKGAILFYPSQTAYDKAENDLLCYRTPSGKYCFTDASVVS